MGPISEGPLLVSRPCMVVGRIAEAPLLLSRPSKPRRAPLGGQLIFRAAL